MYPLLCVLDYSILFMKERFSSLKLGTVLSDYKSALAKNKETVLERAAF